MSVVNTDEHVDGASSETATERNLLCEGHHSGPNRSGQRGQVAHHGNRRGVLLQAYFCKGVPKTVGAEEKGEKRQPEYHQTPEGISKNLV
jgi:hypothetical protein